MRSSTFIPFLVASIIGFSFPSGAQAKPVSDDCDAAKKLVEKFLKLDSEIGRLSTKDYHDNFDAMIVYKIDGEVIHEEPAWDVFTVIRGYKISGCQIQSPGFRKLPTYQVKVSYESTGDLSHGAAEGQCPLFAPKKTKAEEQDFEVLKVANEFKIRLAPSPHVSVAKGLEWVDKASQGCLSEKAKAKAGIHKSHN